MEMDLLLGIILVVVSLSFLIAIFAPDLFDTGKKADIPGLIEVVGKPGIDIPYDNLSGSYRYNIRFQARLEFKGEFSRFGQSSFIDVVPLIRYKDRQQKALSGNKPYFRIDESRTYNKEISAKIISAEPPIRSLESKSFSGEMKKGHAFLMKDQGYFLITLEDIEQTLIEDIFCRDLGSGPIDARICNPVCPARLRIACPSDKKIITLHGNCDKTDYECQRTVECDGTVYISVGQADCKNRNAQIVIEVSGGKPFSHDIGESLEISFWRRSECVDGKNTYGDLRGSCGNDYIGGPYSFGYLPKIQGIAD